MEKPASMRGLFFGLILGGFLVCAGACVTVPLAPEPASPDAALLVIPLEFRSTSGEAEFVFSLNFDTVSDSKTGEVVDFGREYAFFKEIPPGPHTITGLLVRWKPTNQIVKQWEMKVPFVLEEGCATILPVRFSLSVSEQTSYFITYNLLPKDIDGIRVALREYKNFDRWSIAGSLPQAAAGSGGTSGAAQGVSEAAGTAAPAESRGSQPVSSESTSSEASDTTAEGATVESRQEYTSSKLDRVLASTKDKEIEEELAKKLKGIDQESYSLWLKENKLEGFLGVASPGERLAVLDEFIQQSRTRGSAIELMVSYTLPYASRQDLPWAGDGFYEMEYGQAIGGTIAWNYQIHNWISLGLNLAVAPLFVEYQRFDASDVLYQEVGFPSAAIWVGPLVIIGDKASSFAFQVSTGLGFNQDWTIPIRVGLYYRNIYAGYIGQYRIHKTNLIHGFEAGYSLFLGKKHIWPRT